MFSLSNSFFSFLLNLSSFQTSLSPTPSLSYLFSFFCTLFISITPIHYSSPSSISLSLPFQHLPSTLFFCPSISNYLFVFPSLCFPLLPLDSFSSTLLSLSIPNHLCLSPSHSIYSSPFPSHISFALSLSLSLLSSVSLSL